MSKYTHIFIYSVLVIIFTTPLSCFASNGGGIFFLIPFLTFIPSLVITIITALVQFFRASFLKVLLRLFLCLLLHLIPAAIFYFVTFKIPSHEGGLILLTIATSTILAALVGAFSVWFLIKASDSKVEKS